MGRLVGVREGDLPRTWGEFRGYFDAMVRDTLEHTDAVDDVSRRSRSRAPAVPRLGERAWRVARCPVARASARHRGLLPPVLRERCGIALDPREGARAARARPRLACGRAADAEAAETSARPTSSWRREAFARGAAASGLRPRRAPRAAQARRGDRAANLIALALDPSVEPPDDAISERILDAALALGAASGIRNLTMDDVARRARVGRMTVYRRFGDKRSWSRRSPSARPPLPGGAGRRRARARRSRSSSRRGFVTAMRLAREHPLLNRLARHRAPGGARVAGRGRRRDVRRRARVRHEPAARRAERPAVALPEDVDEPAELLVRVGLSFVLIQDTVLPVNDEERLRALARRLVAPVAAATAPTGRRRPRP